MKQSIDSVNEIAPKKRWGGFDPDSRRVGHGSVAWAAKYELIQPQDGTFESRETQSRITDISTRLQPGAFGSASAVEPEDARITGGTRSLVRRLLGLNITPRLISSAILAKGSKPSTRAAAARERVQVA